ncbi:MAG: hypothetical protein Q8N04_12380 [Nitrospira sp.]|nr:hypothetical protein [Nitrospira sp.]
MKERSIPQCAEITLPIGCEPPIVHCPICGKPTLEPEGGGATPCRHVAFIYVGIAGEFEYESDEFKSKTQSIEDEEFTLFTFREFLQKSDYGNELLVLEFTSGGMACGPVRRTDVFGFDYGTLEQPHDS